LKFEGKKHMKKHVYYEIDVGSCGLCRVMLGKRVTRLLVEFIGSGSYQTRLCNRIGRVDMNPTREPELPTLISNSSYFVEKKKSPQRGGLVKVPKLSWQGN